MSKLRYVKSLEQVRAARAADPEFLKSTVRSIRCVYETDPKIARALVPQPLVAAARPEVCVTFSQVTIHLAPGQTMEIGSAVFGVRCTHEKTEGIYLVTMPMTTEQAVVGGRETYGEPKKIAQIEFRVEGNSVSSRVSRMGLAYLEASGRRGRALGPRRFVEHAFCFKALPSCDADRFLDADPLLVRLEWQHEQENAWAVEDGKLTLGESPLDPVADVPVRKLLTMEYEEGTSRSNGTVLRSVPGEWLLPFLHQRYDDVSGVGIEV
jgi:acetoacetate decarboxylase